MTSIIFAFKIACIFYSFLFLGELIKTTTLTDVARFAGVSYATADRVINNRGNVAEKSVRKVESAVSQLGYTRNVSAANLSRQRTYKLAFLIPGGRNAFRGFKSQVQQ